MGNHEVTSPLAAGLPIGCLGGGGRGDEGLETGRGLEERNRLIGPEWGWAYVNFAAEVGQFLACHFAGCGSFSEIVLGF